ncbi:DUF6507 family protein [Microbacterium sp. SA39]|uniref:DUF6507 family protein n=1 Tax=Microbacterium sp. SA39 TaxID=1263625 RepID=UPI0005FA5857|nr:DUF6507 family protein [Microbacterium sp. SA39]KJQ53397.1 hypothetical protein RS85_02914 [Microbacterium sp. SA39]
MSEWRVDPDGVAGVLAGIDDLGLDFEKVHSEIDDAASAGESVLSIDGRTALSHAWSSFMSDRRLVPGKVMYAISAAAQGVGAATVAIIAGDVEMAGNVEAAERYAEDAWGIAPRGAYSLVPTW